MSLIEERMLSSSSCDILWDSFLDYKHTRGRLIVLKIYLLCVSRVTKCILSVRIPFFPPLSTQVDIDTHDIILFAYSKQSNPEQWGGLGMRLI